MCGLFSVIGELSITQNKFINDMFIMDSLRGPDSCGFFAVNKAKTTVKTIKSAIPAYDFIDLKKYDKVLTDFNSVQVGHNRWATKGGVTSRNAHPFTVGDITGVHNGTIIGQYRLPDYLDFPVDSENVIHSINKIGIEETWSKLDGAATLLWWNTKDKTFNMIRNDERPLFFVYSKNLRQMYTASEKFMLLAALDRNKLQVHRVEELPINTLYSFKIDLDNTDPQKVIECTTQEIKPFVNNFPASYNNFNRRGRDYNDWWNEKDSNNGVVVPFNQRTTAKLRDVVDFQVQKKEYGRNFNTFTLSSNVNDETYIMEDYNKTSTLKIGDCATAVVKILRAYRAHLNIHTVKYNSQYEETEEVEEVEDDKESGNVTTIDSTAEVIEDLGESCYWCDEPLDVYSKTTTEGQDFCSECASLMDVDSMVDFEKQSLYGG